MQQAAAPAPSEIPPETQSPSLFFPTEREQNLMVTTYRYEGILADYQIRQLFFDSIARMEARMKGMCDNRYMARLSREDRALIPYTVYSLAEKGIGYVADVEGEPVKVVGWRKPDEGIGLGFGLVRHDVELNDVRIAVNMAVKTLPNGEITTWVNAREFHRRADRVPSVSIILGKEIKRRVELDGFFRVTWTEQPKPKSNRSAPATIQRQARFLLEHDRRTDDNGRFIDEKVLPGIAYIQSEIYRERYGVNAGSYLVVTLSEKRMMNMLKAAARVPKAEKYFYYTTYKQATRPGAFFTQPIWRRPGTENPTSLMTPL